MKLWRSAAGALKDGNSLIAAQDILEAAVVKATSHDEFSMDSDNADFIYRYVRTSPTSLKPLTRAISSRVGRTGSWAVALKGLMLTHGLFLRKVPAADSIGRLPFDLSAFGESRSLLRGRSSDLNLFVRAYFVFLDQRSILFHGGNLLQRLHDEPSVTIRLGTIRKMQNLVDSLMRIKPIAETMSTPLILEAMDNVVTEIMEIYGRICVGISEALPRVHSKTAKTEAEMALKVVAKSTSQAEDLSRYFEFCRDFGVPNAREIPEFVRIPEADFVELEKLVRGGVPVAVRTEDDERPAEEEKGAPATVSAAPAIEEGGERLEDAGEERGRQRNLTATDPTVSATTELIPIPDLICLSD